MDIISGEIVKLTNLPTRQDEAIALGVNSFFIILCHTIVVLMCQEEYFF